MLEQHNTSHTGCLYSSTLPEHCILTKAWCFRLDHLHGASDVIAVAIERPLDAAIPVNVLRCTCKVDGPGDVVVNASRSVIRHVVGDVLAYVG